MALTHEVMAYWNLNLEVHMQARELCLIILVRECLIMLLKVRTCADPENFVRGGPTLMFLAHLSRRVMGELIVYQSLRHASIRRASVCLSTFSNIFSSETTGPIKLKLHMKTPKDEETKVCSNGPGHMTKMATTPIYGKNSFKISSRSGRPMTLGFRM